MKRKLFLLISIAVVTNSVIGQSWIRINQLGYLPESVKVAVFISTANQNFGEFTVCDAITDKEVFRGKPVTYSGKEWGMQAAARLNFTKLEKPGGYYISVNGIHSDPFRISADVYKGTADYVLKYMRQQRCGYNPFLQDSCHTYDGFIVDHPTKTGQIIDVIGGWHDASDYLQYVTTSANAVYQMLFAYSKNPEVYKDYYDASGNKSTNGIPDIIDEAKWGIDWLIKMNPEKGEMYNQIADDRDHRGFRLPNLDTVSYGKGLYRPVYFITGKSQGLSRYKNRTTGVSSAAGKFASAFAIGAKVLKDSDPSLSLKLASKAKDAWEFALTDLGVTQTACTVSPYFYEEDNYVDDLELAAWELFSLTNDSSYLTKSDYWGTLEPVSPWIEKDSARHYQSYPFVNLGHANLALSKTKYAPTFSYFMNKGLGIIESRRPEDPFKIGIPFTWCSNNFVVAAYTQHRLYAEATNDKEFGESEAALRDWIFGCNPWGTSMICGLPAGGDFPVYPHSAITLKMGVTTEGGLIDGPVYARIFKGLRGVGLQRPDPYTVFQNGKVVYHDDMWDYSTNEPTMAGTAELSYMLSSLEKDGLNQEKKRMNDVVDSNGAIIRRDIGKKEIFMVFTADEFGEGAEHILNVLSERKSKASFFLTGNFLRNPLFKTAIKRMISDGHFIGPHSDKHLLYMPWEKRDSLFVTNVTFSEDLKNNYNELENRGAIIPETKYFMAPYEWYNSAIASWTANLGIRLINFTPGTGTNADYTTPDMPQYKSSDLLWENLKKFEAYDRNGLNGAIILIHLGTASGRTDKLYNKLDEMIRYFSSKGYTFNKL